MPKRRTSYELAAGKLISAIQKVWGAQVGTGASDFSEDVMNAAHRLLQARTPEAASQLMGPLSVEQYLGDLWVRRHPAVRPLVNELQAHLPDR